MTSALTGDVRVVVDVGSGSIRGGYAGESKPRCEIPTVIQPQTQADLKTEEDHPPIKRGRVKDWEGVESVLTSLYAQLHVPSHSQHALLLTRHVRDPIADAERFVQIGLESLGASAVYLGLQPVLALYASGATDGVILDCGHGVTQVVPVYQGYAIDEAILRQDLAGCDVTTRLAALLSHKNPGGVTVDRSIAQDIKEKLSYVCSSFDPEAETCSKVKVNRPYTLPSGDVINVDEERFLSSEILFQPRMIGSEHLGLHQLIHQSVSACPIDARGQLLSRIIMAGGTTNTPGICRRLLSEVSSLWSARCRVRVVAEAGRQLSAWRGGSVLASLDSFSDLCVTREQYAEHGAQIIHKKLTV